LPKPPIASSALNMKGNRKANKQLVIGIGIQKNSFDPVILRGRLGSYHMGPTIVLYGFYEGKYKTELFETHIRNIINVKSLKIPSLAHPLPLLSLYFLLLVLRYRILKPAWTEQRLPTA